MIALLYIFIVGPLTHIIATVLGGLEGTHDKNILVVINASSIRCNTCVVFSTAGTPSSSIRQFWALAAHAENVSVAVLI
jgi:hypothetical protein